MTDVLPSYPRRTTDRPSRRSARGAVIAPGVALNPTALALWELCDGRTAVSEIVAAVSDLFALEQERARADVEAALVDMVRAGVIR